jgi:signal transduction histidine kinase
MLIFKKNTLFAILLFIMGLQTINGQERLDSLDIYIKEKNFVKALDLINYFNQDKILLEYDKKYIEIKLKESKFYADLNDYGKSIEILYNTLNKIKPNQNRKLQSKIFLELGTQYATIKDTVNSFKNFYHAEKIAKTNNEISTLKNIYHNLFRLHIIKNIDSAKFYIDKKYQIDKINNEPKCIATSYNNFFSYHSAKKEFDIAKKYLDSAYQIAIEHDVKHAIITSLSNFGHYYSEDKKNFKKALEYYSLLKDHHQTELSQSELADLYLNLASVYESLSDFAHANSYHVLYIQLNQKLYNDEIKNTVKDVESRYLIEKIEKNYLDEKNKIMENQSRNKKLIVISISLLLLLVYIFYSFYENVKLKERNREKEIDSIIQKKIINANIDGQEKERELIATILHDQISALLSSAGLHLKAYESKYKNDMPVEELVKTKSIIKDAHDQIRQLSHQLIPPILIKLGLNEAILDLCEKNSNTMLEFTFLEKKSDVVLKKDFEIKIYYIVSELINNIIKHSEATKARIEYEIKNKILNLIIQDNGIGINDNDQKKGGLGLQQTSTRVFGLNGEITINSYKELKIIIKIPLGPDSISEFNNL